MSHDFKHKICLKGGVFYMGLVVTPKRPKGEDGHKVFSIRIKDEIVEKLDAICAKTGRNRNELIGIFLEYAVDHCEIKDVP